MLNARTPVLVGLGVASRREDDPTRALEPLDLMLNAVRIAASDATAESARLLAGVGRVAVPKGRWRYQNPGGEIARAIGADGAVSLLASVGAGALSRVAGSELFHGRLPAGRWRLSRQVGK